MREASVLEELLEPVSRCFNVDVARALAALRVNERLQARVDELAEKCNEGLLTAEEEEEYEAYVHASTLVGVLQAKARRILAEAQPG
jgi:F420-dependent methylenetetrahydromethanopterin dehydrogenase